MFEIEQKMMHKGFMLLK